MKSKVTQALRKRLENKGILNLPELVDVEERIEELNKALTNSVHADAFLLKRIGELESQAKLREQDYWTLEAQLESVRGFSTSHIHLEHGEVFIKVKRDAYLQALESDDDND